jgi:Fic family protein
MIRMSYIWENSDWPNFRWDHSALMSPVAMARLNQGMLLGKMAAIGFALKTEANLAALTEDVLKSSEIEGEIFEPASVRSSIARRLGLPEGGSLLQDQKTEGVVDMMLDATGNYDESLTAERLFAWNRALFPTGYSGLHQVKPGTWRDDSHGPMQVLSGAQGHEKLHFQAPPAATLNSEMNSFLRWFNSRSDDDGLIRAGVAHLWFVTVHPFEDGNGRIARAIADKALAQSEQSAQRFYSMSGQIRKERADYYATLERTQKGDMDITMWLLWFVACFSRAVDNADTVSGHVTRKASFWRLHATESFTARQKEILGRVLGQFEGSLTVKKWAALGKCSIPTAQRDINELLDRGVLRKNPGGSKNTSYEVIIPF